MLFEKYFSRYGQDLSITEEEAPVIGDEVWFTNARWITQHRELVCGIGVIEAVDEAAYEPVYTVNFWAGVYCRRVYLTIDDLEVIP